MHSREALIEQFLNSTRWQDAKRHAMMADASGRSYERLTLGSETAILMNAPYESGEDVRPFIKVTDMLADFGLTAPEIIARDVENGLLLLEDFGNDLFASVCKSSPEKELELYQSAIETLAELHTHAAPKALAPYNLSVYLREAQLLTQWYMPATTGQKPSPQIIAEFDAIANTTFAEIQNTDPVLVMRDYHAENLIWLPKRQSVNRVGLLDYQDALAGHPAYDLVSLLEDARRDTSPDLRANMLALYLRLSGADEQDFNTAYAVLGAQRNIKIVGIFARLSLRDGKAHYVEFIPRVWDHLMNDLQHPACAELAKWIDRNVPAPTPDVLKTLVRAT